MKGISFNRLADRELTEAIQRYDAEAPGLGDRFLEEVYGALGILLRFPEASPRVLGQIRRFVLPTFPYSLLYELRDAGRIRILAVAHQKRDPRYWIGRR